MVTLLSITTQGRPSPDSKPSLPDLATVIALFIGITCLYATLSVLVHVTAAFVHRSCARTSWHQPDAGHTSPSPRSSRLWDPSAVRSAPAGRTTVRWVGPP
ncbi:hypothetical protein WDA79_20385, partial [Streptomyces sp. A475]